MGLWPSVLKWAGFLLPAAWGIVGVVMAVRMARLKASILGREATFWIGLAVFLAVFGVFVAVRSDREDQAFKQQVVAYMQTSTPRPIATAVPAQAHGTAAPDLERRLRVLVREIGDFSREWSTKAPRPDFGKGFDLRDFDTV